MPRTKVSKNSKRNRDAAIREEKIREFDSIVEQSINALDFKIKQDIFEIESEISMMKERIMQRVLSMTIADLRNLNVSKFSEVQPIANFAQLHITESQTSLQSSIRTVKKSNDEGYLTEDSTYSANGASQLNLSHMRGFTNTGRAPGPLSSAKARRPRRSQSASGYPGSALKAKPSANVTTNASSDRMSRSKLRTPLAPRQKAASADRTPIKRNLPTSPTALLRWPKPGEMVISMTGTPVVSQVMPEQYANVNIPIRDGVLSLRPKRLQTLDPEIVHKIDQETLTQIKLLQSNLELIMSYADKGGKL